MRATTLYSNPAPLVQPGVPAWHTDASSRDHPVFQLPKRKPPTVGAKSSSWIPRWFRWPLRGRSDALSSEPGTTQSCDDESEEMIVVTSPRGTPQAMIECCVRTVAQAPPSFDKLLSPESPSLFACILSMLNALMRVWFGWLQIASHARRTSKHFLCHLCHTICFQKQAQEPGEDAWN